MCLRKGLLVVLCLFVNSASFAESNKVESSAMGYQWTAARVSGISFKHWVNSKIGMQFVFGLWKDSDVSSIDFGGEILYKVSNKVKTNAYFGAGVGWGSEEDNGVGDGNKKTWQEDYGIEGIFGIEHFSKNWENLAYNFETGIVIASEKEKENGEEKRRIIAGTNIGFGVHYYF